MVARTLLPGELATRCDAAALQFDADAGAALPDIVGQDRARAAVEFGIAMRHAGYHLYVMGPPGSGKRSLVRRAIDAHVAADGIHRSDWVYVNNFETPHRPIALQLAAGRGAQLRADMRALVQELRSTIPAAFESEEYAAELERLNTDFKERAERALLEVERRSAAAGAGDDPHAGGLHLCAAQGRRGHVAAGVRGAAAGRARAAAEGGAANCRSSWCMCCANRCGCARSMPTACAA